MEHARFDPKIGQLYLTIVPKSEATGVPFLKGQPFQGNRYVFLHTALKLDSCTEYVIVAPPCAFGVCCGSDITAGSTDVIHAFVSSLHDAGHFYFSMAAQHTTAKGELLLDNITALADVLPPLPPGTSPQADPFYYCSIESSEHYDNDPDDSSRISALLRSLQCSSVVQNHVTYSSIQRIKMADLPPGFKSSLDNPKLNRIKHFLRMKCQSTIHNNADKAVYAVVVVTKKTIKTTVTKNKNIKVGLSPAEVGLEHTKQDEQGRTPPSITPIRKNNCHAFYLDSSDIISPFTPLMIRANHRAGYSIKST